MANYDYKCSACETIQERTHAMSDEAPQLCSECQAPMVRQFTNGFGISLKGAGFYANDYGRSHPRKGK